MPGTLHHLHNVLMKHILEDISAIGTGNEAPNLRCSQH